MAPVGAPNPGPNIPFGQMPRPHLLNCAKAPPAASITASPRQIAAMIRAPVIAYCLSQEKRSPVVEEIIEAVLIAGPFPSV
jgi:hypothetical protein